MIKIKGVGGSVVVVVGVSGIGGGVGCGIRLPPVVLYFSITPATK